MFGGSVGLQQRYMEDVVDVPFARQGEADGEGRDNFLYLKGSMVLVVQLFEGRRVLMLHLLSRTKSPT